MASGAMRRQLWGLLALAVLALGAPGARAAFVDETASRLPVDADNTYDFAVADVDGAGPDILVANNGQSRLLINNGHGVFTDETASRLPAINHKTLAVAFADVDGANGPDIILVGIGQSRLLMNDGTGHFTDETATRLPAATAISMDVAVGDLDGDGDLDVVIANRGSYNQILINDGTGHFTDQASTRSPLQANPTYTVALGDVNGDGGLDIFYGNYGRQNRLLMNNLLGVFTDATSTALPARIAETGDAMLVDVDGDGDKDIVTADGAGGLSILINNGSGIFSPAPAGHVPTLNTYGVKLAAGDVNFDGSLDLVLASMGQDVLLLNDGSGTFTDATASELPADDQRSFAVVLTDADHDLDPDLVVGTPQGQNRYYNNALAAPRIETTVSPSYIEITDTVSIDVTAFDEDGVASTTVAIVQPDSTVVTPTDLGSGHYQFVPSQVGDYIVRVTSVDSLGNSDTRDTHFDALQNDVTNPTIDTFTISPTLITQGQSATFTVLASDDRGVVKRTLTVGGVDVPLDSSGQATYAPTATGDLPVVAEAFDAAGNSAVANGTLTVNPDVDAPVVSLTATPTTIDITNPITINATATDNIVVSSFSVIVNGPSGGPVDEPVVLNSSGVGSYTPYLPGTYTFTATATDPAGNTTVKTASVDAQGVPDTTAPTVTVKVVPGTTVIGGTVTIEVDATDDVFVASRSLTVNGTPVALDSSYQATFTAPVQGTYTAVGTATDPTGNVGTDSVVFSAVDPSTDTEPPVVSITSPADDDELTTLTTIQGTATDLTLVSYELAYAPVGSNDYTVFHTGSSDVIDGELGSLDTTQLTNGFYDIRLTAVDINGRSSQTNVVVDVTGGQKLGQFSVSFLDRSLNMGRLPIDVRRSYDSRRRKESGDFGYGWYISTTSAAALEDRAAGDAWEEDSTGGPFPTYYLTGTRPHTVTIQFSEEDEEKFTAVVEPESSFAYPIQYPDGFTYQPIGDAKGTLATPGTPLLYFDASAGQIIDTDTFFPYDPAQFVYTSDDGYVYVFNAVATRNLRHELVQVTDPSGTTINFGKNGFTRSDGLGLTFTRDSSDRITRITDPNGNHVDYNYDANGDLVAVTDGAGNTTTFLYDSNHYLLEIRDPLGKPLQKQEYDDNGRLIAITDGQGNRVELSYDPGANTETIRDRRGNPTVNQYDSRGNIIAQTKLAEVDGVVTPVTTHSTFDANNEISTQTNGAGIVTASTYNAKGQRLTRTIDPGGLNLTETFTYDTAGHVLTDKDPRGKTITHTYDSAGDLLTTTDRTGAVSSWQYDSSGNVTRATDPLGNYTLYTYNSFGGKLSEEHYNSSDTLLQRKVFTRDANGNKLTETVYVTVGSVSTPQTTTYTYDGNNRVITETDPRGNTKSYEYDSLNRKSADIDAFGHRTEYSYNDINKIIRTDYPDGTFAAANFDADANRTSETDRDGNTITYSYDALNHLTETVLPDGNHRENRYDVAGNLIAEINEKGRRTDYEYDAAGRRTRTLQPAVYDPVSKSMVRPETRYEYDADGNKTAVTDSYGRRTEYTYDGEGRVISTLLPDGHTASTVYDPLGHQLSKTDAAGNKTLYTYNGLGWLTSVALPSPDGTAPRPTTTYAYDEAGRMLSRTDANGHVTTWEYDAAGNKTAHTLPLGQRETFTYDADNRVLTHTDFNGHTTTTTYDAVGRPTLVQHQDGTSVETTYDGEGHPLTITNPQGVTTYAYDSRLHLVSKSGPEGTFSYAYDETGKQASVTAPGGVTSYTYDALDRLATVQSGGETTSYVYDLVGNLVSTTLANGTVATNTYNNRNQLMSLVNTRSDASVISSYSYSLDADGLRTRVTEGDGSVVDYVYDKDYRLTGETRTGTGAYATTYTYDAVGNRLTADRNGSVTHFTYDNDDRLTGEGSTTYIYDANGNRIDKNDGTVGGETVYSYDQSDRLVAVGTPLTTTTQYVYDAAGNRVEQRDGTGAVVKRFLVDVINVSGTPQVLEERDAGNALLASYTYGNDLASQKRGSAVSFYEYDGTGSTRALTDSGGAATDTYRYDGFGRELATTGTTQNAYRFSGEQLDSGTGFYYLRARYYDPETGVFTRMDPEVGDPMSPTSLHRYLYTNDNPINFTDPTGKQTLAEVSISISIDIDIDTSFDSNLVKFFFKAAKICFCQLAPAYKMQSLALDMIARDLPGGFALLKQSRENIAASYQDLGVGAAEVFKNTLKDMVKVNIEVTNNLNELYDEAVKNSPFPNSSDLQKLFNFKDTLNKWLGNYADAMGAIDAIKNHDPCAEFKILGKHADFIAGLIP